MRPVLWSATARTELLDIVRFIAEANPIAAAKVAERVDTAASGLGRLAIGRRGRVAGTFEKPVVGLPYIIGYAIDDAGIAVGGGSIVILHVIHAARDWPDGRWPND